MSIAIRLGLFVALAAALLPPGIARADCQRCTLVKKEPAGGLGNFNYSFDCVDGTGKTRKVTVTSANDNQARRLAMLECT